MIELTKDEIEFVIRVCQFPGQKLTGVSKIINDGSEYGKNICFWENPQKLGLVEAVGSYKWIPTKRVKMINSLIIDGQIFPPCDEKFNYYREDFENKVGVLSGVYWCDKSMLYKPHSEMFDLLFEQNKFRATLQNLKFTVWQSAIKMMKGDFK